MKKLLNKISSISSDIWHAKPVLTSIAIMLTLFILLIIIYVKICNILGEKVGESETAALIIVGLTFSMIAYFIYKTFNQNK